MKTSIIFIYFMVSIPPLPKGKGFLDTRRLNSYHCNLESIDADYAFWSASENFDF